MIILLYKKFINYINLLNKNLIEWISNSIQWFQINKWIRWINLILCNHNSNICTNNNLKLQYIIRWIINNNNLKIKWIINIKIKWIWWEVQINMHKIWHHKYNNKCRISNNNKIINNWIIISKLLLSNLLIIISKIIQLNN